MATISFNVNATAAVTSIGGLQKAVSALNTELRSTNTTATLLMARLQGLNRTALTQLQLNVRTVTRDLDTQIARVGQAMNAWHRLNTVRGPGGGGGGPGGFGGGGGGLAGFTATGVAAGLTAAISTAVLRSMRQSITDSMMAPGEAARASSSSMLGGQSALQNLRANLAADISDEVVQRTRELAAELGVPASKMYEIIASTSSALGGEGMRATEFAKELGTLLVGAGTQEAKELLGAVGDVTSAIKETRGEAIAGYGHLAQVQARARVVEMQKIQQNYIPVLQSGTAAGFGYSPAFTGSLYSALTKAGGDKEGRLSGTAAIGLMVQMSEFLKKRSLFQDKSPDQAFMAARDDEGIMKKFWKDYSGEKKTLGSVLKTMSDKNAEAYGQFTNWFANWGGKFEDYVKEGEDRLKQQENDTAFSLKRIMDTFDANQESLAELKPAGSQALPDEAVLKLKNEMITALRTVPGMEGGGRAALMAEEGIVQAKAFQDFKDANKFDYAVTRLTGRGDVTGDESNVLREWTQTFIAEKLKEEQANQGFTQAAKDMTVAVETLVGAMTVVSEETAKDNARRATVGEEAGVQERYWWKDPPSFRRSAYEWGRYFGAISDDVSGVPE